MDETSQTTAPGEGQNPGQKPGQSPGQTPGQPQSYKIGQAASLLGLKTHVLRFWETEFPQIAPVRTDTGQRKYTEDQIRLIQRIRRLLYDEGLTIDGAKKRLDETSRSHGFLDQIQSELVAIKGLLK